jgi:hypothetical protein
MALAKNVETVSIGLERTDVGITHLTLAWIPVA